MQALFIPAAVLLAGALAMPAAAIVPSETDTHVTLERIEGPEEWESVTGFSGDQMVHFVAYTTPVTVTVRRVEGGSFTSQEVAEVLVAAVTCPAPGQPNSRDDWNVAQPATDVLVLTFACIRTE